MNPINVQIMNRERNLDFTLHTFIKHELVTKRQSNPSVHDLLRATVQTCLLTDETELAAGSSVNVNGCFSLCR